MKLLRRSLRWNGDKLSLEILNLENSVIVFLYDSERGLGTLAFAIPGGNGGGRSVVLLGGKYTLLSRIVAERMAHKYGKPVLALIKLKLPEYESMRRAAQLLRALPSL
ncbi:MAG: proteasome assembly chaperone 4 family protein [Candidatus Bathyarchaeia archaeon]